MIQIIYVSKARKHYDHTSLSKMLDSFRRGNKACDVTGMLLYNGRGTFFQMIEGDDTTISTLYEKIGRDKRHSRVTCLLKSQIDERSFPDWKMGFALLNNESAKNLPGYTEFFEHSESVEYLLNADTYVHKLFMHFREQSNQSNRLHAKDTQC